MDERPNDQDQPKPAPSQPTPKPIEGTPEAPQPASPGVPWGLTAFLALLVAIVVFTWQNTQEVELRFLGWSWEVPLAVLIIGVVVISVVGDEILGYVMRRRRRKRATEKAELRRLRGT